MADANAVRFFQDRLSYTTSPREVVDALHSGDKLTLLDVRRPEAFKKGHLKGAINIPLASLEEGLKTLDANSLVIVYDWGVASTVSTRACLTLAANGFRVREMIGGFEYWKRLGLGAEGSDGIVRRQASDPLVTTADSGWD